MKKQKFIEINCKICNEKIKVAESIKHRYKYCSRECKLNDPDLIKSYCRMCHSPMRLKHRKYCSKECYYNHKKILMKGKQHSEETKKKISKSHTGKIRPLSDRVSMSLSRSGEKIFNGFKSKERTLAYRTKEYKEWRLSVFKRDNFTCVICHQVGKTLEAHHIKSWRDYKSLRYDIDNGITVCPQCHAKIDPLRARSLKKELR